MHVLLPFSYLSTAFLTYKIWAGFKLEMNFRIFDDNKKRSQCEIEIAEVDVFQFLRAIEFGLKEPGEERNALPFDFDFSVGT